MASYVSYATYVIWFSDASEYAFAVATAGGNNFIQTSPANAASLFGITLFPPGQPGIDIRGIYGMAPYGIPGPPGAGHNVGHPLPSGVFLTNDVDSVLVPGQPGNPASVWPAGPDCILTWSGVIVRAGGSNGPEPELEVPIPERRWIGGDLQGNAEYLAGAPSFHANRCSSRTAGGTGGTIRGTNVGNVKTVNIDTVAPGLQPTKSWDRMYFRVRKWPTTTAQGLWSCGGFPSGGQGGGVKIVVGGGALEVFSIGGVEVSKGTIGGIELNTWYRLDFLLHYRQGGLGGSLRTYLNGVLANSFVDASGSGMNANTRHTTSNFGRWTGTDPVAEYDIDDEHDAGVPELLGVETLESIDWFMGSHQRVHRVVSASMTGWAPQNIQAFSQINPFNNLTPPISTTSGASLDGLTDAIEEMDSPALTYGVVAGLTALMSANTGATDGSLGYKIAGAPASVVVNQTAIQAYNTTPVMYTPAGMVFPDPVVPLSVFHNKSADANSDTTTGVQAEWSYIGTWGPEDDPLAAELVLMDYLHNGYYANTPWAYLMPSTDAPVYAVGGTYAGNSTHTTVALPAPAHFIWIRATNGAPAVGIIWFAAANAAHHGVSDRMIPNLEVWADIDGNAFFRVGGSDVNINQTGITYQYIAFCDPGMRFNHCSAFQSPAAAIGNQAHPLVDPNFTPELVFAQVDLPSISGASNAAGLSIKGPGSGANDGRFIQGTSVVNWGSFATGILNSLADLNVNNQGQTNFSAWRSSEPNCAGIMCQIFSYVGNGAGGNRVINVTPAGGRFPLFVIVQPQQAAASFFRDPTHAGANSSNMGNLSNSVTAIVAGGIDTITVGVTLNVNLVTYTVFIIPGDSAGWNNGVFFNPNCEGFPGPGPTPPLPAVLGEGGLILDGTTPITLLQDISGIYTIVPGKTNDTLMDRQAAQPAIDVKIPNPTFKTGYIGG